MLNKIWNTKSAIALALAAIVLPACTNQLETNRPAAPTGETATTNAPTSPTGNVTTEEVTDNTKQLIGKTVTVRSEPVRKVGNNTFTISDEEFFGNETILVVNASGQPLALPTDNTEVQVTGEVRQFVVADVNRDYDFLDLEPNLYVDYEGKPAIIAQSIAPAPEPGEITSNPKQYYGRTLAVTGEVEEILSPTTFTLDEDQLFGATDLLVLVANPKTGNTANTAVKEDQTVAVTGVLRPLVVADLEREYDFNWDEGFVRQLEAEYSQKPVLVVQSVYPSAIPRAAK
ncbi:MULTISPECIES: hypothetical protein [Chroococcidiopsis]|jgi:hypothetical protein|uniref:Lipoprotein n=1 Tax=Chroococcidiopsis thermalis (strain PCC 7203) TaxID=251229 RepID=K9U4W6_CHRTP|nr:MULTISPECIES: hypothetical protein [Chroococcidiopsis]AFY89264.1 hypothetical protein Chro_3840 [Chroococcidiopsis thermalis PCC 7203]PSB44492.1 hypothetical protein C7B80_20495 [Cyanosarcina cf. burmensis CCALA 770]PSM49438.1 hypothetical protein C7Y66_09300 [Chroococcidiopsis sp. CCALA 051]